MVSATEAQSIKVGSALVVEPNDVLVDRLLAEPPAVHVMDPGDEAQLGVWSTDRDCYLLLADAAGPGSRTLETGSGLSTILLTAVGARHTCVTPAREEGERILAYCHDHGIDTSLLTFELGCSDDVLPRLQRDPSLDLVLIDGNHGYPTPVIDWYYAGSRLRPGGLLVVDDVALPAVAQLCQFLNADPRWTVHRRTRKWVAYRRIDAGCLRQDWFDQPSIPAPAARRLRALPGRVLRRVRIRRRRRTPG